MTLRLSLYVMTVTYAAHGQLVGIPGNPRACEEVSVHPNLRLSFQTLLDGHVEDITGAAFDNTRLELRTYTSELKQDLLKRAQTNADGGFSFGSTPAGRYRLLIFAPGFKQPVNLKCLAGQRCTLSIRLEVAPTDA